jgi:hypothetical protein
VVSVTDSYTNNKGHITHNDYNAKKVQLSLIGRFDTELFIHFFCIQFVTMFVVTMGSLYSCSESNKVSQSVALASVLL